MTTVVIIGAGFGGLNAAKTLKNKPVDVVLIDRQNYHMFSPLLYQVATSGLEPGHIAYPVRDIFPGKANIRFRLGAVKEINREEKQLRVKTGKHLWKQPYDFLIVAAGGKTNYFGMEQVEQHGFNIKNLPDAIVLRNHILRNFENAVSIDDRTTQEALTTLVVVGAGPTGIEMAGALQDLYNQVIRRKYRQQFDGVEGRILLIEMLDHVLDPYPPELRQAAQRQLEELGVEVILGHAVESVTQEHIELDDDRIIPTYTLIWTAGIKASPLAESLDVELQRGGRVPVKSTMEMVEDDSIYIVGDMAYLEDEEGTPHPMLIPVAQQEGTLAAQNILRRLKGQSQQTFRYNDRGMMATIGRHRAVAWIFHKIQVTGFLAWIAWLGLHLLTLIGFRNRMLVFVNWVWNYLSYGRSAQIILSHPKPDRTAQQKIE